MMKTKTKTTMGKASWISDITEGLGLKHTPMYFNDKHKTCRRIKFYQREDMHETELVHLQEYIQAKRPELSVTVSRWTGDTWYGNYVVYYRPKVGLVMNH